MLDDLYVLRDRARAAIAKGDLDAAADALVAAASQTHVSENDYASVLRPLEDVCTRRGDVRGALTVIAYLGAGDAAAWTRCAPLLARVPPQDRAFALGAQGQFAQAAREMEDAGRAAAAAVYREHAKEWSAARACWSRLAARAEADSDAYVAALVRFNLARCAKRCGDAKPAREAIVLSVRLLEEAADHFESIGQRERAFDCFQVLAQIGRESGSFEDVLEGFVNSIRILREDRLKHFALETFDEAIEAAAGGNETSAAATLAREAATYARSLGLSSPAAAYSIRQAELWVAVAKQHAERGAPAEIAENALLAAILAFGDVGQYARVGDLYRSLAELDLQASRREHYARAAERYANVADEPVQAMPASAASARRDAHSIDVWHADVLEWEQRGSAAEACADLVADARWPHATRRKAMLARLTALAVEGAPEAGDGAWTDARVLLADRLGQLLRYASLSPLEKLYERPERRVKLAVLGAMRMLPFKRTFVTVRAALRDADPAIVEQAAKAVESFDFRHAFDPLTRIVRESPRQGVRAAALRALARIDEPESAEFLFGILEHGAPADRSAALDALTRERASKFVELARSTLPTATGALPAVLRQILAAHGVAA